MNVTEFFKTLIKMNKEVLKFGVMSNGAQCYIDVFEDRIYIQYNYTHRHQVTYTMSFSTLSEIDKEGFSMQHVKIKKLTNELGDSETIH